jgi:peroxiredoxin
MLVKGDSRMKKRIYAIFIVFMILFTVGCDGVGATSSMNQGSQALDIAAVTLEGKPVQLSTYLKKEPVLLVFFATWCPPCRNEVPKLIELEQQYGSRGLKIIALSVDDSRDPVENFVKEKGISYTVWHDDGGKASNQYGVLGIPTNILIDKKGVIVYRQYALPTTKVIESVLE